MAFNGINFFHVLFVIFERLKKYIKTSDAKSVVFFIVVSYHQTFKVTFPFKFKYILRGLFIV